ncbi:Lsr2 family protein [Nocardia sp. NPDC051911]|uniref:histone-like nucleoid-structuring protein Lsr2 n=1 Tax=Nocardia sp. NPDC051911 TaxID=3154648 RepID=UPI00343E0BEB
MLRDRTLYQAGLRGVRGQGQDGRAERQTGVVGASTLPTASSPLGHPTAEPCLSLYEPIRVRQEALGRRRWARALVGNGDSDNKLPIMETIGFSLDGVGYKITVTAVQAEQLRNAFGEWTTHAREVGRSTQTADRNGPQDVRGPQSRAIRAWARSRGYRVSDRGRIATTLVAAYQEAHGQ